MNSVTDPTRPPSIMKILQTLNAASEDDNAYIVAAAYNLYAEACRRLRGRVLFTPNDVRALSSIIDVLLTERENDNTPPKARSYKLTPDESNSLLSAIESRMKPPQIDNANSPEQGYDRRG